MYRIYHQPTVLCRLLSKKLKHAPIRRPGCCELPYVYTYLANVQQRSINCHLTQQQAEPDDGGWPS